MQSNCHVNAGIEQGKKISKVSRKIAPRDKLTAVHSESAAQKTNLPYFHD